MLITAFLPGTIDELSGLEQHSDQFGIDEILTCGILLRLEARQAWVEDLYGVEMHSCLEIFLRLLPFCIGRISSDLTETTRMFWKTFAQA